jgi:predicted acyl esterase
MTGMRSLRVVAVMAALALSLLLSSTSQAAITGIPDGAGGTIPCVVQVTGSEAGQRWCQGIFTTFDGAPIDINVGFPPAPASGVDGDYPIVGNFHGWGGMKLAITNDSWPDEGFAVFSMSDRGWGFSCGAADPKRPTPVCQQGYNHFMDTRYEVRDAQEVFEALADAPAAGGTGGEGLIAPQKIGVMGSSYGGAMSMALAVLKDRKMVPANDGTLIPWVSDGGKPMRIAAAQPHIPWIDAMDSLMPNGHTLDYVVDAPYMMRNRVGVLKQSVVAGLYAMGQAASNYAPAGMDPDADINGWYAIMNGGEPYDQSPSALDMVDELTKHHSSYYINHAEAPAPLLISNGFTDDFFPADEALRFFNRMRAEHPDTPISLMFGDWGHARSQDKSIDGNFRMRQRHKWFAYYVKGTGAQPYQGVQALTQVCGGPSGGATGPFDDLNSDEPFRATTWARMSPGEIRITDATAKTIAPSVTDPPGQTFDPGTGQGDCATASATDQTGTATYRSTPVPTGGFTLMGAPTVVADINSMSSTSQVAARLLDVDPSTNNELLIARALYRPEINPGLAPTHQVFQLHANGYRFEAGHIVKLELLPSDQPYGRSSNGQGPITVSNLELRLPVMEQPNSLGGLVHTPSAKVVPPGYQLSRDYVLNGYPRAKSATTVQVPLVIAYGTCATPNRVHASPLTFGSCSPPPMESGQLTVGTPDANGRTASFSGTIRYSVVAGNTNTPIDEADVAITISMSDVRKLSDLSDYTGELSAVTSLRITDRNNYGDPATGDASLAVTVPCTATVASVGSDCGVTTTADAVAPGVVVESMRSNWELGQVQVFDGGSDGLAATTPNTVFARQGVFVP